MATLIVVAAAAVAVVAATGSADPAAAATSSQTVRIIEPTPIPNNGTASLSTPDLTAIAPGSVVDLDVGVRIDHPATAQLDIRLVAPDGTEIDLSSDNPAGAGRSGAHGYGFGTTCVAGSETIFDDDSTRQINGPSAESPFLGRYRPEQALSQLEGMASTGVWTLEVDDDGGSQTGVLECFSLTLTVETIDVTTTDDVIDPDDGRRSLREAVALANADGQDSVIGLQAGATYRLTMCGGNGNAGGDLDHQSASKLAIVAPSGRAMLRTTCGGGGTVIESSSDAGPLTLTRLRFDGGGIPVRSQGGDVTAWTSTFVGHGQTAIEPSGPGVRVTIVDSMVRDGLGDGIRAGTAEIRNSTIQGNGGTGVEATAGATVAGSTIQANGGVAVDVEGPNGVTVTDSVIDDNDGGGIATTGPIVVRRSSVTGGGTAIDAEGEAPMTLVATTASGNDGGVTRSDDGPVSITGSTLVGNDGPDIDLADDSAATIGQSIVGRCGEPVGQSNGYNVDTDGSCGFDRPTDRSGVADLGLRALTFGSPAVLLPVPGSLLHDAVPAAACTSAADARHVGRPQGARCEIGSGELRLPLAAADTAQATPGGTITIDVLANDDPRDGVVNPSRLRITSPPQVGRAVVDAGAIRYTAASDGGDTRFTYQLCGVGEQQCSSATVTVRAPTPGTDPPPAPSQQAGYWLLEADGDITAFGNARSLRGVGGDLGDDDAVAMAARPQGDGVWVVGSGGQIIARGGAPDFADVDMTQLTKPGEVLSTAAATPDGAGLWVFTTAGRVLSFGTALPASQMTGTDVVLGLELDGPVVDSVPTPSGLGAYMVAADGGVFTVGDAVFVDSVRGVLTELLGPPGLPDQPVVGIVADPDGEGYWMVAADGGVFSFDAPFRGALPAIVPFEQLVAPVNGMVPYGSGYLLVAGDGGVFNFSSLPFAGSGSGTVDSPVVDIAA